MAVAGPIKWHGGKAYLAKKFIALFPPHIHYVEPYFGGGAVLLQKSPEDVSEVVNDLNGDLTNFWKVLQCGKAFERFQRYVEAVPFSEREYRHAAATYQIEFEDLPEPGRAAKFFVACRQSLA